LEGLEPFAVPVVVVVNLGLVELAEGFEVGCCAGLGIIVSVAVKYIGV
jgi:hypothetical protein